MTRPPIGTSASLYWVMGYIAAAQGVTRCPFRMTLQSGVQWTEGNSAYRRDRK